MSFIQFLGRPCPVGYFRPVIANEGSIQLNNCVCFEEGIAYNGNNVVLGKHNKQKSRYDCQQSCAKSDSCQYWTWLPPATNNRTDYKRRCYLKSKRENFIQSSEYVSGSKNCPLPEVKSKPIQSSRKSYSGQLFRDRSKKIWR